MGVLNCRVLKSGKCEVSYKYNKGKHNGIDLVGAGYTLDYIVAHSDGIVVGVVNNINYNTYKAGGPKIYGNYVKIKHDDGYFTLYAHLKYGTVAVSNGQRVKKGQILGYMGNTGYSNGAHLHFEVRNSSNTCIDPTSYVGADLPNNKPQPSNTYKVGTTYTTQVDLRVRAGAGTSERQKKRNELTVDGQKHALPGEYACLEAGTRVTCYEVKNLGNDVWIRIPSGWIAGYYNEKIYVK